MRLFFQTERKPNHCQENVAVFDLWLRSLFRPHTVGFLIRFDLPSTCPTSANPLGVISLSSLTTYSIFRIFVFTLRVLFSQRFLHLYFTIFTLFCIVLGGFSFAGSGESNNMYSQCSYKEIRPLKGGISFYDM